MSENNLLKNADDFVFDLFKKELSSKAIYHNYNHTLQVVKAVEEIAEAEGISKEDKELVLLAAWFHDSGYVKGKENHEEVSKSIAQEFLLKEDFSSTKIEQILHLIDATKMPQNPTNILEKIICDADLFHLGSEKFSEISCFVRLEWELFCGNILTDIEWLQSNVKFLSEHHFFTDYVIKTYNTKKSLNLVKIQKELRKLQQKETEKVQKNKSKKIKNKAEKEKPKKLDRGVDTMYRITLKNHLKLSDIADTKANILLSVSAIILSIALSTLLPKLDKPDNAFLILPTFLFLLVAVVTMIFSILSTRPKVTSNNFTKKDIADKKVNLLFFGNFHKIPLKEFQQGMLEMMDNTDYLYKSLMQDLYFLGKVLDKKYKLLRVAYTIFMIGIVLSVISFVVSFSLMR
jgi:predicted metal-dependent HD superfamily phosphohydrolase